MTSLSALPEGRHREEPSVQHSLFVVRANWSTLRKLLLQLQVGQGTAGGEHGDQAPLHRKGRPIK